VAIDAAGNLFVIDFGNNRIRRVSNGIITTIAGNGTTGFGGDNGPATSAQLNLNYGVVGLAVDGEGSVYVPDVGNNRVRKISKGVITTVAGTGAFGFSGDNGPSTNARLSLPKAAAVDASGNLYIADSGNNRIRKVSNGIITTIAGGGSAGFSGDNGPALNAQLSDPAAVAVDAFGFVYIADRTNARIRLLTPSGSCAYSISPTFLQAPSSEEPSRSVSKQQHRVPGRSLASPIGRPPTRPAAPDPQPSPLRLPQTRAVPEPQTCRWPVQSYIFRKRLAQPALPSCPAA